MQFRSLGRLRVMRRIEGAGKEIWESRISGGGVRKEGIVVVLRRVLKTRTGQAVWERV